MLRIVKIGGNIVDNPGKLQAFLADFAALDGDKILVHGGGKVATAISAALGIETVMIDGRRVTDSRTLEVVSMVYNGINKQIVSALQGFGCNAIGLCGADGRLIVSKKRSPHPVDYGLVGDPVSVNTEFVRQLADQGYTLVVAPITYDGAGESSTPDIARNGIRHASSDVANTAGNSGTMLLNTNADTVAQTIAVAMAKTANIKMACSADKEHMINVDSKTVEKVAVGRTAYCFDDTHNAGDTGGNTENGVELVYCFEKHGVLLDMDDENSVIPRIDAVRFAELKTSGAVHSGMLPKLENAFRAIESGVKSVVICAAENIARPGYGGTTIMK